MGKNGKLGKVVSKESKSKQDHMKNEQSGRSTKERKLPKNETSAHKIPLELQQLLLNIFKDSFPDVLASNELQKVLQEVKSALYDRDFKRAFGKPEFLESYSVRWSPSRALCYATILADIRKHLIEMLLSRQEPSLDVKEPVPNSNTSSEKVGAIGSKLHAVSFGGGPAEVIAFSGFLRYLHDSEQVHDLEQDEPSATAETLTQLSLSKKAPWLDLLLIDVAQWQDAIQKLEHSLLTPPPLSKYANSAAQAANTSFLDDRTLVTRFSMEDVLDLSPAQIQTLIGEQPVLLTLFFTLNELYTASIGKTTTFLLHLTSAAKPGSLLLVVDSPGSYSEATVGTDAKRYPMHWLLDHTLLDTQKARREESSPDWTKLLSDESRWFRLPANLRYPIPLEDMRYQVHLFRRV